MRAYLFALLAFLCVSSGSGAAAVRTSNRKLLSSRQLLNVGTHHGRRLTTTSCRHTACNSQAAPIANCKEQGTYAKESAISYCTIQDRGSCGTPGRSCGSCSSLCTWGSWGFSYEKKYQNSEWWNPCDYDETVCTDTRDCGASIRSNVCNKCNAGYYLQQNTVCSSCSAYYGYYCDDGVTLKSIESCPAGQERTGANYLQGGSCAACPAGHTKASVGSWNTACSVCPEGEYASSTTQCATCPIGSFCTGGVKTECPRGEYTSTTGQSACQTCEVGHKCENGLKTECSAARNNTNAEVL